MSEINARQLYRRETLTLAAALLLAITAIVVTVLIGAEALNAYAFLGFPFGFYLVGQGLLFVIAAGAFWFARVQKRIDDELGESGEL